MTRSKLLASSIVCGLLWAVPPAGAIVGGQPDGARHPAVGALVGFVPAAGQEIAYCSGSLISPAVFLTAAHCGFLPSDTVKVTFAEQYTAGVSTHSGRLVLHPEFMSQGNTTVNDVAVVLFSEPVQGVTPVRLPASRLLENMALEQSSKFTSVGYGDGEFVNGPGGKTTTHLQARYHAVGSFNALTSRALHLSQNSATEDGGTCYGDSGGPNFIGAGSAETDIIASVTVTGDTYCEATGVTQRLDIPSVRGFLDDYVELP